MLHESDNHSQRRTEAMNSYLLPSLPRPPHGVDRSETFSTLDDDMASHTLHQEALIELRERQVLEQYYAASRVLKDNIRGGSFILAASLSPVRATPKVKTL